MKLNFLKNFEKLFEWFEKALYCIPIEKAKDKQALLSHGNAVELEKDCQSTVSVQHLGDHQLTFSY